VWRPSRDVAGLARQHGSWNRKTRSGYEVLFVPFGQAEPKGLPLMVLSGFLDSHGNAMGRPVGVAVDKQGGLLVADDVGYTRSANQ
jgi:glucose/arabinose dehydrogenase